MTVRTEIIDKMYERFLREFLDILIMIRMREEEVTGYNMLVYLHRRFDFIVSAGTVYSTLYSMERDGLIEARNKGKRRVYSLTPKGEATIKGISESSFGKLLCKPFDGLNGQTVNVRHP